MSEDSSIKKENVTEPVDFFDSEEKEGVAYIKPNLELNLTPAKKDECRKIVMEIKKFGVNQRQILFIIDLLALELDKMEMVRGIRKIVNEERQKENQEPASPGLIIPDSENIKKFL